MSYATAKQIREKRAGIAHQMRTLLAESDGKLSDERREEFERMDSDVDTLLQQAEDIERVEKLNDEIGDPRKVDPSEPVLAGTDGAATATRDDWHQAMRAWGMVGRGDGPTSDQIAAAEKVGLPWQRGSLTIRGGEMTHRATTAQTITTTAGGHTIGEEFVREIEVAQKAIGAVRDVSRVITTTGGENLDVPTANDSTEVATILAINTEADVKSMAFGQKTFSAYKYTSGVVLVPMELMQDSYINLVEYIGGALGTRLARGTNAHFTTGTGSSQPTGVVTDSGLGKTGSTTSTVTYAELLDLLHSVDPAYRIDPSARWMFADGTLKVVKQLTDTQGRPLWLPGIAIGEPDTLLGYPFSVNQDMATMAASAKAVLFGAFNRMWIREVADMELLRLNERYATLAQTAFLTFARFDAGMVHGSTSDRAIKHLIMST